MSKKIGILTFHRAISYGAQLQSYALQSFMDGLGIENEIVDYRCEYMVKKYQRVLRRTGGSALRDFAWSLKTAPGVAAGKRCAGEFADKFLRLSRPYDAESIAEAADEYDAFVTGSDQVWSPTCVGFDPVYFLNFARPEQKYSYAASIAVKKYPEILSAEFARRVADFSGISVRERSGSDEVKRLTGRDAVVCPDPTLLLKREQWDEIADGETMAGEPYIFLFNVLKPQKLIEQALEFAGRKNMKILYLNNRRSVKDSRVTYLKPVRADKFIGLIKNADYVFTNSFHGTVFSVIYGKKFVSETDTAAGENVRSRELLERLGLSDRILGAAHVPDAEAEYGAETAQKSLDDGRQAAARYLTENFL